ncbi:hypothetical protein OROMI_009927 [Orobanche minor]
MGKIKQFEMVWLLVDEMKSKGLLGKDTLALVCRRYAMADNVKEAMEAFDNMVNKLNEVCREMREDGFEPDVVSYGILIKAYCKAKKFDEAIELYHEMEKEIIEATPPIYCTLINAFGSGRKLDDAIKFFELCKGRSDGVIKAPAYNALVGAYFWSARITDAYKIVDEMRKCGVGPNAHTYDIILHHLIKLGKTKEAYNVFKKMNDGPASNTYEIMLRMLCNEGSMDMAMRIWDQMKAKSVLLNEGKEDVAVKLAHRIQKLKENI